jgi:hypothetical protein
MPKNKHLLFILSILLIINLPYLVAFLTGQGNFIFNGFLLNPIDGNSYLAKMQEGMQGGWRFFLPYTADGQGSAFLFLFYLFLGHISRWLGVAPIIVFHFARILGSFFMFIVLYRFCNWVFKISSLAWKAFVLCSIGSGLGWLVFPFEKITSDFWVAEGYPFLSAYVNPHFPVGLGLMLFIIMGVAQENGWIGKLSLWILGILLAIILPFGMVVVTVVLSIKVLVTLFLRRQRVPWLHYGCAVFGGVLILYQYWETITDPQLAIWNQQNLMLSPPLWDSVIAFSPALILAFLAVWYWLKNHELPELEWIVIWFLSGIILIYLPFGLQRRLMVGLEIPIAILAIYGLATLQNQWSAWWKKRYFVILLMLIIPTNMLVLTAGYFGALKQDPIMYISRDEANAFAWIRTRTRTTTVVLASPTIGTFIPAQTGRRVVYGHPLETIHADQEKQSVLDFYSGKLSTSDEKRYLNTHHIEYIFYGPREKMMGTTSLIESYPVAFQSGSVQIFAIQNQ